MLGSYLREILGWRPFFNLFSGAHSRNGYFANDAILSTKDSLQERAPVLEEANVLPALSTGIITGLDILGHDVNYSPDIAGIVQKVNLEVSLTNFGNQINNREPTTTPLGVMAEYSPIPEPWKIPDEDKELVESIFNIDSHDQAYVLDIGTCDAVGKILSSIRTSKFDVDSHYSDIRTNEEGLLFITCKEKVYEGPLIPVPKSHAWKYYAPKEINVLDGRVIGEGTFARILQVSMAICQNKSEGPAVRSVAVKKFFSGKLKMESVIYEADISAYMASLGVGPTIMGLLLPNKVEKEWLPSIMMSYIEGSLDLIDLFEGEEKPVRYTVIDILKQAARLLAVIHSEGLLHNDLKCCNIIVTPNPQLLGAPHYGDPPPAGNTGQLTACSLFRVFLIDFGQSTYRKGARYFVRPSEYRTLGAYPYLAPEARRGVLTNEASETYSFGMMLRKSCHLLMDDELEKVLAPIIERCVSSAPADRPSMGEVECWLAALLPKFWTKCR